MSTAKAVMDQFAAARPGDVGIIGDPVAHSLSPAMHERALQAWWKARGGNADTAPRYHLFHVNLAALAEALEQVRTRGLIGVNVTVPHKEAVCENLNGLIGFAGVTRSVNTIVNQRNQLVGYNTDGDGFIDALEEDFNFHATGRTALVLGTGGTGAVLIQRLLHERARRVYYWNRSPRNVSFDVGVSQAESLRSADEINDHMANIDLVVNATSVGLKADDSTPLPGLAFRKGQFVYDVIYHRETEFLRQAKTAGAETAGGLSMLLHQGAKSFEIWTGASAPLELMRKGLKKS